MGGLYDFFGQILAFFYDNVVANLGVSIILLTAVVMLALFPLTAKQAKAMLAMQRVQPEIKKLQAKYKGDRQKLNEEMMKFYQENHINPLAGCLPLVVQLPIFIGLSGLLRNLQQHVPKSSSLFHDFKANAHDVQHFLGMDLSKHATGVSGSFFSVLPYFLLVGLVVVTGFMQARQSQRNATQMTAQMAMITKLLPIGFGLFSLQFPSGLVLYFFIGNLWRIGQQEIILRKITGPAQRAAIDVKGTDRGSAVPTEPEEIEAPAPRPTGLRKLFRLPAAAGDGDVTSNGSPRAPAPKAAPKRQPPPAAAKAGSGSTAARGGSGAARAAQPRKRSNKKRRKR